MANKKKIAAKSKTKTSKYSKLMVAASKELADKKKALAKAEKALAAAQKSHTELLQETARLDMLERSLKALVEGTEPPQNVRYIYNYPQWVWYGSPNGWWWNGNTWQANLGTYPQTYAYNSQNFQLSNAQSGQFTTTNAINTTTSDLTNINCSSGALNLSSGTTSFTANSGSVGGVTLDSGSLSLASISSPSFTMTTTNGPSSVVVGQSELTVDLSTGADDPEAAAAFEKKFEKKLAEANAQIKADEDKAELAETLFTVAGLTLPEGVK